MLSRRRFFGFVAAAAAALVSRPAAPAAVPPAAEPAAFSIWGGGPGAQLSEADREQLLRDILAVERDRDLRIVTSLEGDTDEA